MTDKYICPFCEGEIEEHRFGRIGYGPNPDDQFRAVRCECSSLSNNVHALLVSGFVKRDIFENHAGHDFKFFEVDELLEIKQKAYEMLEKLK